MGSSVFSIGLTGLKAANLGLSTAGHNIANVNTAGYSRQTIQQSAQYPAMSGSGFVGMGVQVTTISRSYDQFLNKQVQSTQAKTSYYDSYLSHIKQIDNLVADSSAGVSPAIEDYFTAVQNVATHPSNQPARQAMLSSAQTLLNRFQSVNQQLADQRDALNGEITDAVASINSYAKQISDLNQQVVMNSGSGQTPNDLLDQRDQIVKQLNTLVKATTFEQSDGSINVFIGTGQNLVVGGAVFSLAAVASPADPQSVTVAYQQNGSTVYLPENSLSGGELGGLLDFRTDSLNLAQNNLGQVALGLTQMLNAQQRAGMDLNGKMGQDLFSFNRQGNLDIALGGATISIASSGSTVPTSDFSLDYNGTDYVLTRLSDKSSQTITAAQMSAGYTALGVTVQNSGAAPASSATANWSFPPAIGHIAPNALNAGNASIDGYISDVSQLQASDYELGFDGSNYVMTRLSDGNKTTSATMPLTVDGVTLDLTGGAMQAGDRFTIQPYQGFINSLSVRITDARELAAASPMRAETKNFDLLTGALSTSVNKGTGKIESLQVASPSSSTTSSASNPAVQNPVGVQFTDATHYTLYDLTATPPSAIAPANQTFTSGTPISYNGWSLNITGQPTTGDQFVVRPNLSGTEDGSNALKMAALQTTKLMSGKTATFEQTYAQMVASIGTKTNEVDIMADAQSSMLSQAEAARDSVSGVNLDEEAANLLRYQQAYTAASKLIQIAQQAFDELAHIGG